MRRMRGGGGMPTRISLGLLAVALLALLGRDVLGYAATYTDEDQTLIWLAGRDLIHLHWRSPNFWGQNYNTVFEGIPGQLLHLAGLSLRVAGPLGAALIILAGWVLIAGAALRRGHVLSAAVALGLPLMLSLDYLICLDVHSGVLAGDLLAASAVAAAVFVRRPALRVALVLTLVGLAYQWDNASIAAGAPAVVAAFCPDWRQLTARWRVTAVAVLAGLLLPAAWLVYHHQWYAARPDTPLSPSPAAGLHLSVLWHNLSHPAPLLNFFGPELLTRAWIAEAGLGLLVLAAVAAGIRYRRLTPAAVGITFALVVLVVMSVQDTIFNYQANIYLASSRFLLPMPWGIWLVAHHCISASADARAAAHDGTEATRPRQTGSTWAGGLAFVVALSILSAIVGQLSFAGNRAELVAELAPPNTPEVTVENAAQLLATCRAVTAVYRSTSAQLLVTGDRPLTYGCAADTGIDTLYPSYDRRYWVINRAADEPVQRILFEGGYSCAGITASAGVCVPESDGMTLFVGRAQPAVKVLTALNIPLYDGTEIPNLDDSVSAPG